MKPKYLVTLLTSSKLLYLKLSYDSFYNQFNKSNINYEIIIIINTLNNDYASSVLNEFNNKCKVIRTDSNGFPGKGHNSCIEYFRNNSSYDYLIPIDGDDFVYPWFLDSICNYNNELYKTDILLLPFSDIITKQNTNDIHYPFKTFNWVIALEEHNLIQIVYEHKLSPFDNSLKKINNLGRLILVSRNALNINFKFTEDNYYDDLNPLLEIIEHSYLFPEKYKLYLLNDTNLFIYNKLNEDSCSIKYNQELNDKLKTLDDQWKIFYNNKFLSIRNWNIKFIKTLKLSYDKDILIKKFNYIKNLAKHFPLNNDFSYDNNNINKFHSYLINNDYKSIYL